MNAIYAGSFDPITNGHLDVIVRGAHLFDHLVVAVARNESKSPWFSVPERLEMVRETVQYLPNVSVDTFSGLVVDYVRQRGYKVMLRGIRTMSDFEYEFQMALTNRAFAPDVETVFVMASLENSFISSRLVKEAVGAGGDVGRFVPRNIEGRLRDRAKLRGPKP